MKQFLALISPSTAGLLNVVELPSRLILSRAFDWKVSPLDVDIPSALEVTVNLSFMPGITDLAKIC